MGLSREVFSSLYGAYRLARYDGGGMAFFDTTLDGFWRSFFAAVIIAPFYVVVLYMRFDVGEVDTPPARFVSVEVIAYVISWVAFPVVMISLARFLECSERYLAYIVAYNWASVLQNALYLPLAMLSVNKVLPMEVASTLSLIVLLLILVYTWFITRTALDLTAGTAAGVVALDLILSIFINATAENMF